MTLADIIGYLTIPCTEDKHGPCLDKRCTCWCHDEFVAGLFKRPNAGFEPTTGPIKAG